MDINALAKAYERLVAAAGHIGTHIGRPGELTGEQRAQVDWTLSHVALSDRMLTGVARQIRAGQAASIDNTEAMDQGTIDALIESTSHEQRTRMVADHARELVTVLADTPIYRGSATVPTRLVDRSGHEVLNTELVWHELITARATQQIPGHAARLEGFLAAGASRSMAG